MSCSPDELREYLLGELDAAGRQAVETHARACSACEDELERLRVTHAALLTLREEEIPQRIGFVSDKVFEPAPWRRVWSAFWGSGARVAFAASVLLLAASIVWTRPAPAPAPAVDLPALEARFEARMRAAVTAAVAESESRQKRQAAEALTAAAERHGRELRELRLSVDENLRVLRMRYGSMYLASNGAPRQ